MLTYLILAILIGILAGTITGIIPGIHINFVAAFLLSTSIILKLSPSILIAFISSMAITHTFIDFIPSIYFGAPDEDTALSVMPGHKFLLKGRAHLAILLTLLGSASSIALIIVLIPLMIFLFPKIYPFFQRMMPFILIVISIFLISREHESKLWATLIFILAGFLGIATLNLPLRQPLLPLLTGLFGSSTLIYSISKNIQVPRQKIGKILLEKKEIIKPLIGTVLISPLCSFLPGLGSSQSAIISSELVGKLNRNQFLILLGSINTLVMSTSFITLYTLQKSRTGAANAIFQITQVTQQNLILIFIAIIISATISFFVAIKISKLLAKNIHKVNYSKISTIVLIFLSTIIIVLTGLIGFLIFLISTILGLTTIYAKIRRSNLMGALIIPTILLYLPFI
jgi:putative membrane protein